MADEGFQKHAGYRVDWFGFGSDLRVGTQVLQGPKHHRFVASIYSLFNFFSSFFHFFSVFSSFFFNFQKEMLSVSSYAIPGHPLPSYFGGLWRNKWHRSIDLNFLGSDLLFLWAKNKPRSANLSFGLSVFLGFFFFSFLALFLPFHGCVCL